MLYQLERRAYIEKKLLEEGKIRASALADFFAVSPETIRKDLLYLEEKGIAIKEYGGAVLANQHPRYAQQKEKKRIAKAAADLIEDGMILMLDAGSTEFAVAKMLGTRSNLTVFTLAPQIALLLDDYQIKTYIFSVELRDYSNTSINGWTIKAIKEIQADAAIVGTSGFMGGEGPSVENLLEMEVKKAMMHSSNNVIVVGDSSKAFTSAPIQYCEWEDVDAFITDKGLPDEMKKELGKKTQLVIV